VNALIRATTLTALRNADSPVEARRVAAADHAGYLHEVAPHHLGLRIYNDLAAVEEEWRRFERGADCTAFQTFDWLATWYRHVGARESTHLVIAVGRFGDGETAFILPLCVTPDRWTKRLSWLGQELCDYNAPLLTPDFSQRVAPEQFLAAWRDLQAQMQRDPQMRHDWIEFEKMPQKVGGQINPFSHLSVIPNASGMHLMQLGDDWEKFYTAKRSSATRRRDRAKRRHMSEFGEIRFVTAPDVAGARMTLEILMEQKCLALARRGIANIFARPGYREFYLDLASNPQSRHLVHISRVEIGATCAATNLGIVFGDCYYHVLASFADSEVSRYGPGALHLRELMAHAIKLGLKRFDFTIGDEAYKLEWSDTDLELYDYSETASWRGLPACWSSGMRRRIKRFIKQTPPIWRFVSQVRSAIGVLTHMRLARRQTGAAAALPEHAIAACAMGDMDLLRPLALARIPSAVVSRPGRPSLYSRYAQSRLCWNDYANNIDGLIETLTGFGKAQPERPVLFYQEDAQVLFVSRHRERLAEAFRFVVADAGLVEDLLDKSRFQALAERHGLPVPSGRRFDPAAIEAADLGLRFPLIVKPLTRLDRWNDFWGLRKALCAANVEELRDLWPQLQALGLELLAQEFVPGAESRVESYHCYVDRRGAIAGEFTGRKIRTYPVNYGHTTALEITDAEDVRRHGRAVVEKLQLSGVAKLDFKRDPQGVLRLLEINPRFNLWHHPGAIAGVNIPALVYADLIGLPRPPVTPVRAGVRWCRVWKDFPAARASGVPLTAWLPWMLRCEAKSSLSWDDPLPFLRSTLDRVAGQQIEGEEAGAWAGRYRGTS
jgi:CelD/BcsL family acetyltransferase involved in cellulose biosynthesis/glutathione synthase/RimK-type ligase-like ATP-grasp enzyme